MSSKDLPLIPEPAQTYQFGPYRLDAGERVLLRNGEPVTLSPKVFDTLLVFLKHTGQVLDKPELMREIWPETFVEEANLAVNISTLRKILGDRPDGGSYVETVPRRGYRFIAGTKGENDAVVIPFPPAQPESAPLDLPEVSVSNQSASSGMDDEAGLKTISLTPLTWIKVNKFTASVIGLILLVILIVIGDRMLPRTSASPHRLAIMPFRNLKPEKESDFLGYSLADAVITKLGYVSSIIVRPSPYVEKYRNQQIDPKQVAADLNVDMLLTGTYIKDEGNLRITVQLIDVSRDEIVWRESLDTKYDKLFTVQDSVAQRIIDGLNLKVSSAETERIKRDIPQNSVGYEYFLQGVDQYSSNEFKSAIELLQKAVQIDPNYALAWAHLGRAYSANASFQFGGRVEYLKAESAYERALSINPDEVQATIFLANLYTDTNRVEKAVPLLRKLLAANPNLAEAHWELGYTYRFAGMLDDSIRECELARELDPNVKINSSAFNSYLYVGKYDKFVASLPTKEDSAFIVFYRGFANYHLKNWDQAAADFNRAYELNPSLYTQIGKAFSYSIKGQRAEAAALLRDTEAGIDQRGVSEAEAIYKLAEAYAIIGDKDAALRVMRKSIESGFFCYPYFAADPLLENIRKEPGYETLMGFARTRHEEFKQKFF